MRSRSVSNVEENEVLNSIQELKSGSLVAINKMNDLKRRIERYQKQVVGWRNMAEKHSEQLSTHAYQEGKLVRIIMRTLKSFKRMKTSRDIIDEKLMSAVQEIRSSVSKSSDTPSVSTDQSTMSDQHIETGYNKPMDNLIKDGCPYSDSSNFNESTPRKCVDTPSEANCDHSHADLVHLSMCALHKTMRLLNAENVELRKRLKATTKQLKDVKYASYSLNEKVMSLEFQLEQVKEILRVVEVERDIMKEKLLTINGMIEEEEVYFNDKSSSDESYNELYVSTKEFDFSDLEVQNSIDNYRKTEHTELSLDSMKSEDSKSLEFILPR